MTKTVTHSYASIVSTIALLLATGAFVLALTLGGGASHFPPPGHFSPVSYQTQGNNQSGGGVLPSPQRGAPQGSSSQGDGQLSGQASKGSPMKAPPASNPSSGQGGGN